VAGAVGYSFQELPVPESPGQELEFVLAKAATLRVHLNLPEDFTIAPIEIRLTTTTPLYEQDDLNQNPQIRYLRKGLGMGIISGRRNGDGFRSAAWVLKDPSEDLILWGLQAQHDLVLAVQDGIRQVVATSGTIQLDPAQERLLSLALPRPFRDLHGQVVDSFGQTVASAQVGVRITAEDWFSTDTNAAGQFLLKQVGTATISLAAEKEGRGRYPETTLPVPQETTPLTVTLEPGRSLLVHVVDQEGTAYPQASLTYAGSIHDIEGIPQEDGGQLLSGLPQGAFDLALRIGGYRRSLAVAAGLEEMTVEIPVMAKATISLAWSGADHGQFYHVQFLPIDEMPADGQSWQKTPSSVERSVSFNPSEEKAEAIVPALLPGRYSLKLWRWDSEVFQYRLAADQGLLEVHAGESLKLQIDL